MPTGGIQPGKYAKAEEKDMAETVNQENNEPTAGGQEKTFTQAELNAVVMISAYLLPVRRRAGKRPPRIR